MSFKCQNCNKISELGVSANKIVTKKRKKTYHYYIVKIRTEHGKIRTIITEDETIARKEENKLLKEYSSQGWEIVEEKVVCKECKEELNG